MTGLTIGHVGSQNLTTFQTFVAHNFLLQFGMATQFSEIVHNFTGFPTHLTGVSKNSGPGDRGPTGH